MRKKTIELKNVSKKIKDKEIIKDISLEIYDREIFGLLGPNGAGKTTMIKMILGLNKTTTGTILINEKDINTNHEICMSSIGAIIESPSLYSNLSGYENLKLFANMYKNIPNSRLLEVSKTLDLSEKINNKVKTYSLGMKQRLAIAIALINDPKILILDEPTNGLDAEGIFSLRNYLKKLSSDYGKTIIVSSHMLNEMELLCDRFAIISKGTLIKIASEINTKEGTANYVLDVDNQLKTLNILKLKHDAVIKENQLHINTTRENIPEIVSLINKNDIKIYSIFPKQKSLEEYYFKVTGECEDVN